MFGFFVIYVAVGIFVHKYLSFFSFFFRQGLLRHPGWSVMAQSQVSATSPFWAQTVLPPQLLVQLGLRYVPPHPANILYVL